MPDEKPPIDRALDLFVYAPVGMALYVRDMFPSMMGIFVSRGKREVTSHLGGQDVPIPSVPPVPVPDVADIRRRMGEGIGRARGVAGGGIGLARDVTGSALQGFMSWRTGESGNASDSTAWRPEPEMASGASASAFTSPATAPVADRAASAPTVEELPIPDYDELSASQVIERLDGLDAASLEAIRAYEAGHRGRNTILGKIAQLT
ncbi:MAG: hypothetical protein WD271_06560 [Acidimicrobiia bacterium]